MTQKLLRAVPLRDGFDVQTDERQRLVLTKPCDWAPLGGDIFQFKAKPSSGDIYPARFSVYFEPITKDTPPMEEYYGERQRNIQARIAPVPYRAEYIHLGGDPDPIRSLKIVVPAYGRVRSVTDITGKESVETEYVGRRDFDAYVVSVVDKAVADLSAPASGWEALGLVAGIRSEIAPAAADAFERGELRNVQELRSFVREQFTKRLKESVGGDFPQDAPDDTQEPVDDTAAAEAVQGATGIATPAAPEERVEVQPIGIILVVCYNRSLHRVFSFEFSDNAGDYVTSSVSFDHILRSVRFL